MIAFPLFSDASSHLFQSNDDESLIVKLEKLTQFNYKETHLCLICHNNQAIASHTISQKNLTNFLFLNQKKGCVLYQKHTILSDLILKLKIEKKEGKIKEKQKHLKTNIKVASTVPAFCSKCEHLFILTDNPIWLNKENEINKIDQEQLIYELLLKSLAWEIKQIEKAIMNHDWLITSNNTIINKLKPLKQKKELEQTLYFLNHELAHIIKLKNTSKLLSYFKITISPIQTNCMDLKISYSNSIKKVNAVFATTKSNFLLTVESYNNIEFSNQKINETMIENTYYAKVII
jgi:hypothetical protein